MRIWINETKFLSYSKYLARHQSYIYFFHLNNSFVSLSSHNILTPFIYFLSFSYSNIPSQHMSSLAGRFNLAIKLSVFLVSNPYPFPIIWNNKFIFFYWFSGLNALPRTSRTTLRKVDKCRHFTCPWSQDKSIQSFTIKHGAHCWVFVDAFLS